MFLTRSGVESGEISHNTIPEALTCRFHNCVLRRKLTEDPVLKRTTHTDLTLAPERSPIEVTGVYAFAGLGAQDSSWEWCSWVNS